MHKWVPSQVDRQCGRTITERNVCSFLINWQRWTVCVTGTGRWTNRLSNDAENLSFLSLFACCLSATGHFRDKRPNFGNFFCVFVREFLDHTRECLHKEDCLNWCLRLRVGLLRRVFCRKHFLERKHFTKCSYLTLGRNGKWEKLSRSFHCFGQKLTQERYKSRCICTNTPQTRNPAESRRNPGDNPHTTCTMSFVEK